ncbi:GAF domain-containing protein [Arenibaculum pallidiluteum]|uniref:GAF domain-containing protein n=1 Tax=Arenibaculum pallidiluteum TaxID=2812559 RepID=UPI001A96F0DC|nr:GAF domain-containing protein [Arenibaculum pallidiluteum]
MDTRHQAPMPLDETARLEALRRYEILDTPPEETLDRITALASRLFGMPISLVTLLDENRQWFKSRHGIPVEWTSRDVAFCAHAILGEQPMVVEDAARDIRFAKNPLVTGELGIRFYAGAPLRTPEGHALGTVCVIDRVPHHDFDEADRAVLQDLAGLVMLHLESRDALRALRREIEDHLRTGRQLQAALSEKDVLLREVHHRVKNNMQSVVAMLQFERVRLGHLTEATARMEAIEQRIVILGRIHEQLYASGQLDRIDLSEQLRRLAEGLSALDLHGFGGIAVEAERLACDLDTAVPLGLIANELLMNSIKHAAPVHGGWIRVTLQRRPEADRVDLVVADGGRDAGSDRKHTIRAEKDRREPGVAKAACGIGMTLVRALASQIDASVVDCGPDWSTAGWSTTVSIPANRFR